jgi:hypothetical protein
MPFETRTDIRTFALSPNGDLLVTVDQGHYSFPSLTSKHTMIKVVDLQLINLHFEMYILLQMDEHFL